MKREIKILGGLLLLVGISAGLTSCLNGKHTDGTVPTNGSGDDSGTGGGTADNGSGSGSGPAATLTIDDLATNPSHPGQTIESYSSPCTVSTLTSSVNNGTTHSYYDIISFIQGTGGFSYSRLWYQGTNCYLSPGDSNPADSVPDGDGVVQINLGGTASIVQNVSGSKFIIQFNNTAGSTLSLQYTAIKNWYSGACINGPSFTYASNASETRTMNGINCNPWGDFPSTASGDDGKLFNVIEKVDASTFKLGVLPTSQMGPGINKSIGNLDTSTTPTVTFTRYTY